MKGHFAWRIEGDIVNYVNLIVISYITQKLDKYYIPKCYTIRDRLDDADRKCPEDVFKYKKYYCIAHYARSILKEYDDENLHG